MPIFTHGNVAQDRKQGTIMNNLTSLNIPPKVQPGYEHIAKMIEAITGPRSASKSQGVELAITITNMLASAGLVDAVNHADHVGMRA